MSDDLDMTQFREIFLSEARENLQVLNQALVALEKNPGDVEKINPMFRVAHTLKGMAATMGFEKITDLAHHMEDVLDKIRKGKAQVTSQIVDVLFDCLDALEKLVSGVEQDQSREVIVLDTLIQRLHSSTDIGGEGTEPAKPQPPAPQPPSEPTSAPEAQKAVEPATDIQSSTPQEQAQPSAETPQPPEAEASTVHVTHPPEEPEPAGVGVAPKAAEKSARSGAALAPVESIRVNVSHLDMLLNLVGEMVINKGRLEEISEQLKVPELEEALSFFDRLGTELQEAVLKTRMVPVSHIFDRFPRMVRDVARKLGKDVDLEMAGTDIEIDRTLLEQINEPLVHILRNAIDHGIETREARAQAQKVANGTIFLTARREQSAVVITIADDGRGMSSAKLKAAAMEKGILTQEQADQMTDRDAFFLICDPRFSTAKEVTDISGRGVGMDVVRSTIESFNGTLLIDSREGEGTMFTLKLPLSLAIIRTLLVQVHEEVYAIPLSNIIEIVSIEKHEIKFIDQKEVIVLRNEVLPLIRLDKALGVPKPANPAHTVQSEQVVVVEITEKKVGFVVNQFMGRREIVVKTLSGIAKHAKGFSGATILGDGRVVLILDTAVWL